MFYDSFLQLMKSVIAVVLLTFFSSPIISDNVATDETRQIDIDVRDLSFTLVNLGKRCFV